MNSAEILKSTETDTFSHNLISSDVDLLNKVKQVIEVTGCSHDVAVTSLFDSNYNIEVAIDKIFEQTPRNIVGETNKTNSDWKEVAKYKKKQTTSELTVTEQNVDIKDMSENKFIFDKSRSIRGTNRGRGRFVQNNCRNYEINNRPHNGTDANEVYGNKALSSSSRGRGKRSQYRAGANQTRSKHQPNQELVFDDFDRDYSDRIPTGESNKWSSNYETCNDWLSDSTGKSNDYVEFVKPFENHRDNFSYHNSNSALNVEKFESNSIETGIESIDKTESKEDVKENQLNPLELVAKATNKDDIFGEFSRTKPPAPSSKVPLEPVKLLTSSGVAMCTPVKTGFSFGLNFNEYSQSAKSVDSSESFISKIISNQQFDGINVSSSSSGNNKPLPMAAVAAAAASASAVKPSPSVQQENCCPDELLQSNFPDKESQLLSQSCIPQQDSRLASEKSIIKSKSEIKSNEIFSNTNVATNQRSMEISSEKKLSESNTNTYKLSDCVSNNHQSLNTGILSSSSQLCPPPGMSNAHLLQQFQNNPQYFSLLNIPNGSSIFSGCNMNQVNEFSDVVGPIDDNQTHQSFMHSETNKEFNQKPSNSKHNMCNVQAIPNSSSINQNQQVMLSKISDSESQGTHSSTILSAMPMSNICCFPPVYMNNFANFMSTVPPGHNSSSQASSDANQSSVSNKQIFNLQTVHRNYPMADDYDDMIQNKQKFQRAQNYVSNFVAKPQEDTLDVEKSTKLANNNPAQINRQSNQQQNLGSSSNRSNQHQTQQQQQQQQQQSVSNDTRFLAFHHQHSNHPYQNNMFNCVTATGAHPTAPHPYAMAHQGGGLQQIHPQLHLMQQQMHNFPTSYQYQEHLMPSMVSNPSSRNNISQGSGSSGNQSRSNRANTQIWHPSN